MVGPEAPDRFSWAIAILIHAELIFFAAVLIGDDELDYSFLFPEQPVVHSALVRADPPVPVVEEPPGMFGRWPMNCDHGGPLKKVEIWDDRLGDGMRCEVCGWPWWVIRAMSRD